MQFWGIPLSKGKAPRHMCIEFLGGFTLETLHVGVPLDRFIPSSAKPLVEMDLTLYQNSIIDLGDGGFEA